MNPHPAPRIRLNSWLWPISVAALLALEIFFPYQGWLVLLIGMGLTWLIAWAWVRFLARGLSLVREIRYGWAQVGDLLEERFSLKNTGAIPAVWIEVRDHSTLPGYQVSAGTGVEGHSSHSWITQQVCSRRGLFRLGPTTLIAGDPFGIYTLTLEYKASAEILVTPPVLPLPAIPIATSGQEAEGRISRKMADSSPVMAGVREYHSGDSLRRIHWPTTARRDALFVKTSGALPSGDWWILLDLDRAVHAGDGPASTVETAILLAAAAAERGLSRGYPVGLAASGAETVWLPPRVGAGQRLEILEALAKASPGDHSLAELIRAASSWIGRQASLIVITPSAREDWLAPLLTRVQCGAAPTVLLLDPIAFGGPESSGRVAAQLGNLEIPVYPITPDTLPRPDLAATAQNRWEWRRSPYGKVVAIHQPPDISWKVLQ